MPKAPESAGAAPRDDALAVAETCGLHRLTNEHLSQLARATSALQRHLDRLPRDLPPAAEPAAVFRPTAQRG